MVQRGSRPGWLSRTHHPVSADYAGRHPRGRGQAAMFLYMSPDPRFVCFPNTVSTIAEIGVRTRQCGVQDASQPAQKERCSRLSATHVYCRCLLKYPGIQINCAGAAHTGGTRPEPAA